MMRVCHRYLMWLIPWVLLSMVGFAVAETQPKRYMISVKNGVADQVKVKQICVYYKPANPDAPPCTYEKNKPNSCLPYCQRVTPSQPGYVFSSGDEIGLVTRIAVIGRTTEKLQAACLAYMQDPMAQIPVRPLTNNTNYLVTINYVLYDDLVCSMQPQP